MVFPKQDPQIFMLPEAERDYIESAKDIYRFIRKKIYYDYILYPYARYRHRQVQDAEERSQSHTYTSFYRSPGQLSALVGPVIKFLQNNQERSEDEIVQINVLAGSTGAEAYTIASVLLKAFTGLPFRVTCSDLHDSTVEKSKSALYSAEEVAGVDVPPEFIDCTFEKQGEHFKVNPEVMANVEFFQADIVKDNLIELYPPGDIVLIQNVLFHLNDLDARRAFDNALATAKPRSAIFIDGMSLDMRVQLTAEANLEPLSFKIKEIHEHAHRHLPRDWWNYYYGFEPYLFFKANRSRRYSTVFLRG